MGPEFISGLRCAHSSGEANTKIDVENLDVMLFVSDPSTFSSSILSDREREAGLRSKWSRYLPGLFDAPVRTNARAGRVLQ